ncbi:baseplate J family protein [Pandoraea anapnoica]|uniref:Baseplate J family protein n=1 Tax=Pandoraea anapnoica TaxID=2508301 RepID=A0A5E5AJU3_9BURK|nr:MULTISPECIES: baseplate J/gp47 family protein [Pandoraea]VVE14565.1 baseplate J family protein [Pandoraea iniqua]VVE73346.1 baseplate J family protein [Pandoraea anapnoica]
MPATVLTLDQIRANILREIQNQRPEADVSSDSDYYVRASGTASAIEGLYQYQSYTGRQFFFDTADEQNLIKHARMYSIERKPAVAASGDRAVVLTGVAETPVASGLSLKYRDGTTYTTTSGGQIGADQTLVVGATADVSGTASNRVAGDALTLTVPPMGVNAAATVQKLLGGADIESLESLAARVEFRMQHPPAGGNKYDYWQWAMEVPGVTAAYVYPLRRGLGTVDVVVLGEDGLPSDEVLQAVQNNIDNKRPVTAKDFRAISPTIKSYDVRALLVLDGISIDEARQTIKPAIDAYAQTIIPGMTVICTRIGAAISDCAGVLDYDLLTPLANVVPQADATVIEWCRLGDIYLDKKP